MFIYEEIYYLLLPLESKNTYMASISYSTAEKTD